MGFILLLFALATALWIALVFASEPWSRGLLWPSLSNPSITAPTPQPMRRLDRASLSRQLLLMSAKPPGSNASIEELIELASSFLTPEAFSHGLDEDQAESLITFHQSIASRFGNRAASRACSRLGGVPALQQLLKAMHKRKIQTLSQSRLMAEIDAMLKDSSHVDAIRDAGRPSADKG